MIPLLNAHRSLVISLLYFFAKSERTFSFFVLFCGLKLWIKKRNVKEDDVRDVEE